MNETPTDRAEDPVAAAVRAHFMEWHGCAPDEREIAALLSSIDAAQFRAEAESRIRADCARHGVEPVVYAGRVPS